MPPPKRPAPHPRRLLGDARRETVEAAHIAKRRRLADSNAADDGSDAEPDDIARARPAAVASGALGDDDAAIFADAIHDADDADADAVYTLVEERMQSRRRRQRETVLERQLQEYRDANPTIAQQFAHLKSGLAAIAADDWAAIPDIGDSSVRKEKLVNFTPAPDALLDAAAKNASLVHTDQSDAPAPPPTTDLAALGAGRSSVLGHNLDTAAAATSATTHGQPGGAVDRDDYLTALTRAPGAAAGAAVAVADIGDVQKARRLLRAVTRTNPSHAPGWVAAARLEEQAGKLSAARAVILAGCRAVAADEEVWLEAGRLHPRDVARRLYARAARAVPRSERLWLAAAALEEAGNPRRRVVRRALEILPASARLWRAAVELERPDAARVLLARAVECAPQDHALWTALARLEDYDAACKTLARAREALPSEPSLVVARALLEEARHGADAPSLGAIVCEGVAALLPRDAPDATGRPDLAPSAAHKAEKTDGSVDTAPGLRATLLDAARQAERSEHAGTASALVRSALPLGVDKAGLAKQCEADAAAFEKDGHVAMARTALQLLTEASPESVSAWRAAVDFERRRAGAGKGNGDAVQAVLTRAVKRCPRAGTLWRLLARDVAASAGIAAARALLDDAVARNPRSEAVWFAASDLELQLGDVARARIVLTDARTRLACPRAWVKAAVVERHARARAQELALLHDGLCRFPRAHKLWLMLAQWHERGATAPDTVPLAAAQSALKPDGNVWAATLRALPDARAVYAKATAQCPRCAALWTGLARLEERRGSTARARAALERARERLGADDAAAAALLWRESALLEARGGRADAARATLARALGAPRGRASGPLWAAAIALDERRAQKARSVDAIKAVPGDACVMAEVGLLLWRSGRGEKARTWVRRAVEADPAYGDAWATLLALALDESAAGAGDAEGLERRVADIETEVAAAEPRYGDVWVGVSKRAGNERLSAVDVLRIAARRVSKQVSLEVHDTVHYSSP